MSPVCPEATAEQKQALKWYREILRIRRIEEAIAERYADQEMRCPVHLSIGQEAVPVGVVSALRPTDEMFSTHRAHAHYLAKGGDLSSFIAELYGKATGCTKGKGGSMHLVDLSVQFMGSTPIVGSSFPVAAGAAFANQYRGEDTITVVFMGEGMAEEGVFSETLNFAALKNLPLLMVCEDNLYSVYTGLDERQPKLRSQSKIAEAHGVQTWQGDGNKVDEVAALSAKAVEHLRTGNGPAFIELTTYRWREHCGPNYDNNIGYREESEYLKWKQHCPLDYAAQLAGYPDVNDLEALLSVEIETAFEAALAAPFPQASQAYTDLYAGRSTCDK